jgi:hypothetical protein
MNTAPVVSFTVTRYANDFDFLTIRGSGHSASFFFVQCSVVFSWHGPVPTLIPLAHAVVCSGSGVQASGDVGVVDEMAARRGLAALHRACLMAPTPWYARSRCIPRLG